MRRSLNGLAERGPRGHRLAARVEETAARLGVLGPPGDEAPAEGHEDPLRLAAPFRRTVFGRPGRAVPHPEHRVGRGDVPAGGVLTVVALGQVGAEVAGDLGRGSVESEAATHAAHCDPVRLAPGAWPPELALRLPRSGRHTVSLRYEHMFAFSAGDPSSPRPRSSPPGWPTGSGPPRRWPVAPCRCPRPCPALPGRLAAAASPRATGCRRRQRPGSWRRRRPPGSWRAVVGLADPGVVAAAGLGLDLRRVGFRSHPGNGWAEAAGDLLSGVDAVLDPSARAGPPDRGASPDRPCPRAPGRPRRPVRGLRRLAQGGDLALSVGAVEWEGIGRGHGHLSGSPRRGAGQRPSGRRPGQRVLAVVARRFGTIEKRGGGAGSDRSVGARGGAARAGADPVPVTGRRRPERSGGRRRWNGWSSFGAPSSSKKGRKGEEAAVAACSNGPAALPVGASEQDQRTKKPQKKKKKKKKKKKRVASD